MGPTQRQRRLRASPAFGGNETIFPARRRERTENSDFGANSASEFLKQKKKKKKKNLDMEAFGNGGYVVDEKAVRVENIFLDFLKRFFFIFLFFSISNLISSTFLFNLSKSVFPSSIGAFDCVWGNFEMEMKQLQIKLERDRLRGGDRSHESHRVDHHVRRLLPRDDLQQSPPEGDLRRVLAVRALLEERLQEIRHGAKTHLHLR